MSEHDVVVIGGGLIGSAIAFGLARLGQKTMLLDEGDLAYRAARGNFGLIWVQGKGHDSPRYADWTKRSARLWPEFNRELEQTSGIETCFSQPGGLHFCLDEGELARRQQLLSNTRVESHGEFDFEMLDHQALTARVKGLGARVAGASFCPLDGHVNPLYLLSAIQASYQYAGGQLRQTPVKKLMARDGGFEVITSTRSLRAKRVVVAAGLGVEKFTADLGLKIPIRPNRGQILVTEKIRPFLNLPTNWVRQTAEGSVLLGDSKEDVGHNERASIDVMQAIAQRACRLFPFLKRMRLIRAWGALRTLSPDGLPVYGQSLKHPGLFAAVAHSGVTLAAVHALELARYVADGDLPDELTAFSEKRFYANQI